MQVKSGILLRGEAKMMWIASLSDDFRNIYDK